MLRPNRPISGSIGVLTGLLTLLLAACSPQPEEVADGWEHLSSRKGDLPPPGPSPEQTASLVLDVDRDGLNDFIIASRVVGPSIVWFRRGSTGWKKYIIDARFVAIESGGAYHDIDGDGDLDIVFGGDGQSNQIWWWENPYPNYEPAVGWRRRFIKASGSNKHHDQIFGDFDGDGRTEMAAWNQRAKALLLFEIPLDARQVDQWPCITIYTWLGDDEYQGLAAADLNRDGHLDIVGGGYWFEHVGERNFAAHLIKGDDPLARVAVGDLKPGGWLEVVLSSAEATGPARWYEWGGESWVGHDLGSHDITQGHSLAVADVNGDGHLDIFLAEIAKWRNRRWRRWITDNPYAKMQIFYGNGTGRFRQSTVAAGFGNHEAKLADLDGDGDIDILGKPYKWDAPRVDVWLNSMSPP